MATGILELAKSLGVTQNVSIRVIDEPTGKLVSEHVGHNAATNTLLMGIGYYLLGNTTAVRDTRNFLPTHISLGTMGLSSQDEDENGLPTGVGTIDGTEEQRFIDYLSKVPGFGSDGYSDYYINNREYFGLGPMFQDRASAHTIGCELISTSFPRGKITYREMIPEYQSEHPKTIDIVYSAMISTGALAQFREPGMDHIFISEVGLWNTATYYPEGDNGLLAGYRISPTSEESWDMSKQENRDLLKRQIIRVGINQVVQVIWKIQLGAIDQLGGINAIYPTEGYMQWHVEI